MTSPEWGEGPFDKVHPNSTQQTQFQRPDWFSNLPNFIQFFLENFLGVVVQAIFGSFIPGPLGTAFSQLANFFTSVLPAQILEPLSALVTLLVAVLDSIPIIGPPLGNAVEDLAALFGLLKAQTDDAQGSASTALSEIAALKAAVDAGTSGELIIDNFDRAAANNLGADWSQSDDGGSGELGTDGNGNAKMEAGGTSSTTFFARYQAKSLDTDYQVARFLLGKKMIDYFVDPEMSLILRCDSDEENWVEARIDHNSCEIGYVLSGSYTRIGATATIKSADGDLWEFRAGTGTSSDEPYTFQLLQNGVPRCERVDTGHNSEIGSSYRYAGMRVKGGVQVVFGVPAQKDSSPIQVFTATDRDVS
jgi:hypothetical protein